MNYNILGYLIYALIISYITIIVVKAFHKSGRIFIHELFQDEKIGDAVNNILLVAYYLLNIGNAILMINNWPKLESLEFVLIEITSNVGQIVLLLAIMHYVNITGLLVSRKFINKVQIKN